MSDRWALSNRAEETASAAVALLAASRKTSLTVQWMPEGEGCRFEFIRVDDGEMIDVARIDWEGRMVLDSRAPRKEAAPARILNSCEHGPNPAEDTCERCGGSGCEPSGGAHDHACCPADDCCGGPCAAHPCWDLTT